MITKALIVTMKANSTLVGLLGESSGIPSIFSIVPFPTSATYPVIVTEGATIDTSWDSLSSEGRDIEQDIRVYAEKTGSIITIDQICLLIRQIFHRKSFIVDSYNVLISDVSGPTILNEEELYGRVLRLKIKLG